MPQASVFDGCIRTGGRHPETVGAETSVWQKHYMYLFSPESRETRQTFSLTTIFRNGPRVRAKQLPPLPRLRVLTLADFSPSLGPKGMIIIVEQTPEMSVFLCQATPSYHHGKGRNEDRRPPKPCCVGPEVAHLCP